MPTVSVIVPNYNHARYLRKRVDSILAQTFQDFELILLDDCSRDESRDILNGYASHPRVTIEFNEKNSGTPFKQWNRGVGLAHGRYVWMAESDDYADERLLERLVAVLDREPEAAFAYCRARRVGEDGQDLGFADSYLDRLNAEHWKKDFVAGGAEECRTYFVLCAPVWNASTVVFRKEAYERAGMADERMCVSADYLIWAKMALAGKVGYVAEPLSYYRTHGENVRTRTDASGLMLAEYFYVMRWLVGRVAAPETLAGRPRLEELYGRPPAEMSTNERVHAARRALAEVARWNLRHNTCVPQEALRAYFVDWEFALVGKEFALSPPNRWRFFLHRLHFYQQYSPGMGWKQKLINLARVAGAPLVGYRRRHWPQEAYSWIAGAINRSLKLD